VSRERGRSAIEPVARYTPAAAPARPRAPGESDALSWTPGGGLSPPPVLGAGAARTTSTRCATPPLPPPALLTHPQPVAPRMRGCLHTLSRASQIAMIALLGAREHLEHALAQIELLYNTIRGWMGRIARVRPSLRVPCDRVVCACRCPGPLPAPFVRMWSRKRLCT